LRFKDPLLIEIPIDLYCGVAQICLKDLRDDFMGGAEIRVSEPVVSFRESVMDTSDHTVMSKSPNKHNRLYIMVRHSPLPCLTGSMRRGENSVDQR
jgi:hypothetical protein